MWSASPVGSARRGPFLALDLSNQDVGRSDSLQGRPRQGGRRAVPPAPADRHREGRGRAAQGRAAANASARPAWTGDVTQIVFAILVVAFATLVTVHIT